MQEFKMFNGYPVKDEKARESIENLKSETEKNLLEINGELTEINNDLSNNTEWIDENIPIMKGVMLKLLSITGGLKNLYQQHKKDRRNHTCRVYECVDGGYLTIICGAETFKRININLVSDDFREFLINQVGGYNITTESVYSCRDNPEAERVLTALTIDDVAYETFPVLEEGFEFYEMVYSFNSIMPTGEVIKVTTIINTDGVTIMETVPSSENIEMVTGLMRGSRHNYLVEHGNMGIFDVNDRKMYMLFSCEVFDKTSLKKIRMKGGL